MKAMRAGYRQRGSIAKIMVCIAASLDRLKATTA
jgi:hypothetical protein